MVDLENPVHKAAEKMPIMADQDKGAGEVFQGFKQDFPGLDIQVVGGFIQQQDGGADSQDFCQGNPHLPWQLPYLSWHGPA